MFYSSLNVAIDHSCLENHQDRGAWWAAVCGVAQSQTWLKRPSMHACIGGEDSNPLQCSCLETPRDRGAWWAAVYGVAQSRTWLKRLSSSSSSITTKIPSSLDYLVWRKQMNIRQNSKVVQNPLEWGAGINGMDRLVPSGIHYLSSLLQATGITSPWRKSCLVVKTAKNLPTIWETLVRSLGREDPLEKGMATHSSILAWIIPWTEEPKGQKQSDRIEWVTLSLFRLLLSKVFFFFFCKGESFRTQWATSWLCSAWSCVHWCPFLPFP